MDTLRNGPRHRIPALPRASLGVGWWLFLIVITFIAFVIIGRHLKEGVQNDDRHALTEVMEDPKTMLQRFIILRGQDYAASDERWHDLLEFMSRDDRAWLEENLTVLSGQSPTAKEEARRYAATQRLLHFDFHAPRPLVSSIQTSETAAVAFIHEPSHFETLMPVFLVREGGLWKIRRFLGARDTPEIMGEVIKAKRDEKVPLEPEETEYLVNPKAYAAKVQSRLYSEAGLPPDKRP